VELVNRDQVQGLCSWGVELPKDLEYQRLTKTGHRPAVASRVFSQRQCGGRREYG
jgi:hypothetical protein